MRRRTFVGAVGGSTVAGVAGCLTRDSTPGGGDGDALRIATYPSMVEEGDPAGVWLKEAFESEYPEAEISWTVPENGINTYIERARQDAVDADVYFGLNVDELVRVDDSFDGQLFRSLERDRIEGVDRLRDDLTFGDPNDRVLPYDTGYISLVYDESVLAPPESLDALLDTEYEDTLITQNAQSSDPGLAFLLWTIAEYGADGYLEYWRALRDNGVQILDGWSESYFGSYAEEERPMIVSYSTDQVFHATGDEPDLTRHQIAFPNEQGYENPEGMAIFADSDKADLAADFMAFVLSSEAQAEIARRNVQFPAVADDHVELDESFAQYAHAPAEPVAFTYDDLRGNLDGWIEDWAREFASQ
uniref:Periplasmic protein n=1 Tax=Halobacterium sp. (strain AS7092) TaxID=245739 RepID=Q45FN9_HALAS|nr:periplasmic protein [Halobacterium sp. AS7092]